MEKLPPLRLIGASGRDVSCHPLAGQCSPGLLYSEFFHTSRNETTQPEFSLFADDKHLSWILFSPNKVHQALSQLSRLIVKLREFGLLVNPSKSQAIVQMNGKGVDKLKAQIFCTRRGEATLLRLPKMTTSDSIKLVQSIDYMGIRLSYSNGRASRVIFN